MLPPRSASARPKGDLGRPRAAADWFPSIGRIPAMESNVENFLTKARENLLAAESEFMNGRYKSCANRCYYACFHAAVAALLRAGVPSTGQWNHDYVQARFSGQLINRRKRYQAELQRILPDNQRLRNLADYASDLVPRSQASRALSRSRTFVLTIIEREGSEL